MISAFWTGARKNTTKLKLNYDRPSSLTRPRQTLTIGWPRFIANRERIGLLKRSRKLWRKSINRSRRNSSEKFLEGLERQESSKRKAGSSSQIFKFRISEAASEQKSPRLEKHQPQPHDTTQLLPTAFRLPRLHEDNAQAVPTRSGLPAVRLRAHASRPGHRGPRWRKSFPGSHAGQGLEGQVQLLSGSIRWPFPSGRESAQGFQEQSTRGHSRGPAREAPSVPELPHRSLNPEPAG